MNRSAVIALTAILLALSAALAPAQVILNPSFEEESDGVMPNGVDTSLHAWWGMPDHWQWRSVGNGNGHAIRYPNSGWVTDGDWVLSMFTMVDLPHEAGDFLEWYQTVDLSGVDAIFFDAILPSYGRAHTLSYLSVDGQDLWSSNLPGEYLGVLVDVADLEGPHELALGVRVVDDFQGGGLASGTTYWDNLQVSGPVATERSTWSGVRALFR